MERAIAAWREKPSDATAAEVHAASEPRRQELFRRLNLAPGGTAALVRMREQLMDALDHRDDLAAVDDDFVHLFSSWFNRGFLVLRHIDWSTPAIVLEKIIRYEAVHAIRDWDDLRRRIDPPDRRCYAFFHPALVDEPLIFVEVALTRDIPDAIAPILATGREIVEPDKVRTAVFYSISNCQRGLAGVSFGNFLIKQVVEEIAREMPKLSTFVTLSPVPILPPGSSASARTKPRSRSTPTDKDGLWPRSTTPDWWRDAEQAATAAGSADARRGVVFPARATPRGLPVDAVARFHLGNGARLERINWLADTSEQRDGAGARAYGELPVRSRRYREEPRGLCRRPHRGRFQRGAAPAAPAARTGPDRRLKLHDFPYTGTMRAAGDAVVRRGQKHDRRRDLLDLRPGVEIGLRHRRAVGRRVHDRGRDRVDQDAVLGHFLGQRHGQRGDAGLGDRVGRHAGAAAPFQRRAAPRH